MPNKKRKVVSKQSKSALAKKSKKKGAPAKRAAKARTTKKTAKKAAAKKTPKRKVTRKRSSRANLVGERSEGIPSRGLTANRDREQDSGDLEGLSRTPEADSESVDELLEEGNAFEAGAVAGVEEADNADEKEVHTHEVPEDDVPEEYLDEQ